MWWSGHLCILWKVSPSFNGITSCAMKRWSTVQTNYIFVFVYLISSDAINWHMVNHLYIVLIVVWVLSWLLQYQVWFHFFYIECNTLIMTSGFSQIKIRPIFISSISPTKCVSNSSADQFKCFMKWLNNVLFCQLVYMYFYRMLVLALCAVVTISTSHLSFISLYNIINIKEK